MKNKKRIIFVLFSIVLSLIIAYIIFRGTYLETLEIGENYISIYWQNIKYMSITLLINFILTYLLFYITNKLIKRGLKEFFEAENKKIPRLINKSISFVIAIIASSITSNLILEKALLFINNSQFGKTDPIFNLDIGYFIFQKPFIEFILFYILIALAIVTVYAIIYCIICFNKFFDGIDIKNLRNSKLLKYLTTIIMIFVIFLACLIFISTYSIETDRFIVLQENTSQYSLYGAGTLDVTIKLWGYRILSLITIISVYKAIKAFKKKNTKKVIIYILVVPIYIIILIFVLLIGQAIVISPNELEYEKAYIQNNINYTKDAYGINVEEVTLHTPRTIETSDLNNKNVINNIPMVGEDVLLKDLNSSQTAEGYYTFKNTRNR